MRSIYMRTAAGVAALLATVGVQAQTAPSTRAAGAKPTHQMQTVLDALQKLNPAPIPTLSPDVARRQPNAADAVIQVIQDQGTLAPDQLPAVGKVTAMLIPGPQDNPIRLRVYQPKGDGPFPVIVYYHGGGWVIGSLDAYDTSCRLLTKEAKAVVVSVDYRQAPEHKFPAAVDDAYAALQYVMNHTDKFNGKPGKVAVVGESAGGNLAAVVCLAAKQRDGKLPVAQVLVYPITNDAFDTESYQQNANAKPLNAEMMHWFFKQYLKDAQDGSNVLVSPLRASTDQLKNLPPATVVTAQIDPLRSEGKAYADKLRSAGVDTAYHNYDGVTHEFFGMAAIVDQSKDANAFVAQRLKQAFGGK